MTAPKNKTIHQKILDVKADIVYLYKGSKNKFQGYNYTNYDQVVAALHAPSIKHKLSIIPNTISSECEVVTDGKGKIKYHRETTASVTVYDADNPENMLMVQAIGESISADDKSCGIAYSYAVKNALLKLFMLPCGEDPEQFENKLPDKIPETKSELHSEAQSPTNMSPFISTKQIADLRKKCPKNWLPRLLEKYGVEDISGLKQNEYIEAMETINEHRKTD